MNLSEYKRIVKMIENNRCKSSSLLCLFLNVFFCTKCKRNNLYENEKKVN